MSVIMKPSATTQQLNAVLRVIESHGLKTDIMHGEFQKVMSS